MINFKVLAVASAFILFSSCSTTRHSRTDERKNSSVQTQGHSPSSTDAHTEDWLINTHPLAEETLHRQRRNTLKQATRAKDPLTRLIGLCYSGKEKESMALSQKIYHQYQKSPSYWNQVGSCYALKRQFKIATLYYNKAIELAPNYPPALNNIGVLYASQGHYQKALIAFNKAAQSNTFSLTPLVNKGQLYLKFSFSERAERNLRIFHKKNPPSYRILSALGMSHLHSGDTEAAEEIFRKLIPRYGVFPQVGVPFALILAQMGQKKKAQQVLNDVPIKRLGQWKNLYTQVKQYIQLRSGKKRRKKL